MKGVFVADTSDELTEYVLCASHRQRFYAPLVLITTSLAGVITGDVLWYPGDPPNLFTILVVLSLGLLSIATVSVLLAGQEQASVSLPIVSIGTILYGCVVVLAEPFTILDHEATDLIYRVCWLAPLFAVILWFG